jgi:hypothetical protein
MGMFKHADQNKDGKLSKNEAPGPLKERFERIDADKDGQLAPAELIRAGAAARKQMASRRARGIRAEKPAKPKKPEEKGEKKEKAKKGETK